MTKAKRYPAECGNGRCGWSGSSAYPSQWAAVWSIAQKIGCTKEALRRWVQ